MARSKHKQSQRRKLRRRDGENCHVCGGGFNSTNPATLDHLLELCQGGQSTLDNLALAHRACNSLRSNKPVKLAHLVQVTINQTKHQFIDRWEDDGGFTPTRLRPPRSMLG